MANHEYCDNCGRRTITRSMMHEARLCPRCVPAKIQAPKTQPPKHDILELSAAPEDPMVGAIFTDKENHKVYVFEGTGWMAVGTERELEYGEQIEYDKGNGRRAAIMAQKARKKHG